MNPFRRADIKRLVEDFMLWPDEEKVLFFRELWKRKGWVPANYWTIGDDVILDSGTGGKISSATKPPYRG